MKSRLYRYLTNAQLQFPIGSTGVVSIDPITGNVVESVGSIVVVSAYLKQVGKSESYGGNRSFGIERSMSYTKGRVTSPAGTDRNMLYFKGRLTEPSTWAELGVKPHDYLKSVLCRIGNLDGRLILEPSSDLAAVINFGYLPKLGESISGWFDIAPELGL